MKRIWLIVMGFSLLLGAACSRSATNGPLPPIQGPALVLFYTDN